MPAATSRTIGLPIAVAAIMLGVVFAANHERYGTPAASAGLLVAVVAALLAVRLFRSGRSRSPVAGATDNPDGSTDT